ncbi:hypothetical protein [Halobacteriovorax sp. HLS]|uniref:hypothetical protein n=1 Tax=Halobacteriovorax sp. HLS TaxID=2234000 RepID=UPI000FD923C5|nr:hypothetical protein [Halobacteriovorax sp. HLS]
MEKIKFKIDHIDPLGQGISKSGDQVAFIEKVLPGEEGYIDPIKSKKKGRLIFSRLLEKSSLTVASERRIKAECEHFNQCAGCHFLHTDYENEIAIKKTTAKKLFSYLPQIKAEVEVICAPERFGYRNRLQLHYNNETMELGLVDPLKSQIVKIENCKIANQAVSNKVKEIYQDNAWEKLTKFEKNTGHIEIYDYDGKVELNINKNYAHGGFSQVNEQMNEKMKAHLHSEVRKYVPSEHLLLDLFGGGGNLSKELTEYETLVIDGFPPSSPTFGNHQTFKEINLYSKDAISKIQKEAKANKERSIILDPPRSGMKNLQEVIEKLSPNYIFMINCEVSSAIRDLKSLDLNFEILNATIFDLFPGTRHFETFTTIRVC